MVLEAVITMFLTFLFTSLPFSHLPFCVPVSLLLSTLAFVLFILLVRHFDNSTEKYISIFFFCEKQCIISIWLKGDYKEDRKKGEESERERMMERMLTWGFSK